MTTPVWTELVCRTCAIASNGRFAGNGRIEVRKLRADAERIGWRLKHDECFCSIACLNRHEREQRESHP